MSRDISIFRAFIFYVHAFICLFPSLSLNRGPLVLVGGIYEPQLFCCSYFGPFDGMVLRRKLCSET